MQIPSMTLPIPPNAAKVVPAKIRPEDCTWLGRVLGTLRRMRGQKEPTTYQKILAIQIGEAGRAGRRSGS